MSEELAIIEREIERLWPEAQARWSRFLLLRQPRANDASDAIAAIDLSDRQVWLNTRMIRDRDLTGSIEALLAHEIGHHVRYPGSLGVDARLRILERPLLPFPGYSAVNLFTDLMINEQLGRTMAGQLAAVYRAFSHDLTGAAVATGATGERWKKNPAFVFYLSIYEELWRLPPGDLAGGAEPAFAAHFPGYRAEAHIVAQDLFRFGPNLYAQFLFFLSVLQRYVSPIEGDAPEASGECRRGEPSADEWADALTPNAAEREAIERAIREGWISHEEGEKLAGELGERIAGVPGVGTDDAHRLPEVMAAYYRQQAERFLFRPPRQRLLGEAVVPTTLEDWQLADPVHAIDWIATLTQRGEVLGTAQPLLRTKVAEHEGFDVPMWQPRMEIYLDVSGSMPDPRFTKNALTLAAQILCASTIRAGGWVRAVLYSSTPVAQWEWSRSEVEMSRFLMHYVGGGTNFPFGTLEGSVRSAGREQPIRVVITDRDFDANYDAAKEHPGIFAEAVTRSAAFVLLLHHPDAAHAKRYRTAGAQVIEVDTLDDFPRLARDLAFALFPDGAESAETL
jgi:hypothetical protein